MAASDTATVEAGQGTGAAAARFDRNELAGAFGDIGTDLPLLIGMILIAKLDTASVLIMYGLMQVFTGLFYRLPMPVQPLKAVAILVIAPKAGTHITPEVLYGGGVAIGIVMLLLSVSGLISWIGRVVPLPVVRGIQFGLGMQLASLALTNYVHADGAAGYCLAGSALAIGLILYGNRKYPAALFIILIGAVYACAVKLNWHQARESFGFNLPRVRSISGGDIVAGFLALAATQVPLSIGNSILAAARTARDLFPERAPGVGKISLTYSFMNLVNPWFSGVPTCHGSGGLAGYYTFGARTGGAVLIYGSIYLFLGLFLSAGFANVIQVFPLPMLGVILLFEGIAMVLLVRDQAANRRDFFVTIAVGLMAANLPYGYLIAICVGTLMAYALPGKAT